ncbi:MAG: BACON domain-containing protein, partial [bacterium]
MYKTNSKSTILNGFLAFVMSAFMIIAGCKKNSPMQPDPVVQSPQLHLSATSLAFSDNQLKQQIIISNQSGGSFSWALSGQPGWLTFSKSQGTVSSSPDTITAQADPTLGNGDYSATVTLSWGGDNDPRTITATYQVRNKPALSINTSAVSLSNDGNDAVFVIANGGAGTLSWNVAQKPGWLEFSKESGAVTSIPDSVSIRPMAGLSVGDYTGQIDISSNGGQHTVQVTLKVEQVVEIFPGTGAAGLNLNDTYFKLLFIHGAASRSQIALVCSGSKCIWVHFKYYDSEGLMFVLVSSSNVLKASDPV